MERFKLIPAVHLFLIKDDQILLSRRFQTGWEDGNYSVPAGHVDRNETATNAMAREVEEEVCIKINPEDLKMVHVMHRKSTEERIDFFLLATKWSGDIRIGEPEKCDELKWFPTNNLPSNTIPYLKKAIENYQNKIFYSEFGW